MNYDDISISLFIHLNTAFTFLVFLFILVLEISYK